MAIKKKKKTKDFKKVPTSGGGTFVTIEIIGGTIKKYLFLSFLTNFLVSIKWEKEKAGSKEHTITWNAPFSSLAIPGIFFHMSLITWLSEKLPNSLHNHVVDRIYAIWKLHTKKVSAK
ncbi:hypothetical protein HN803_00305 [candidate division WWE3 bacterium]|jgi:hypothetical protein|nr:hypothetical protein [candidate division WWE3 bacterium]MBT7349227.1 hypothetical protein [candidate division WWE3 bacterium]